MNSAFPASLLLTIFRDSVMAPLASDPKPTPTETLINRSRNFFHDAHSTQKRDGGEPYSVHLDAVAMNVDTLWDRYMPVNIQLSARQNSDIKNSVIAAAFGHDYLEDWKFTDGSVNKLRAALFPELTIQIIEHLTKRRNESYKNFIFRLMRIEGPVGTMARFVKICDLRHNLSNHKPGARRDKYELSREILSQNL